MSLLCILFLSLKIGVTQQALSTDIFYLIDLLFEQQPPIDNATIRRDDKLQQLFTDIEMD
jgi:hypothetical protein